MKRFLFLCALPAAGLCLGCHDAGDDLAALEASTAAPAEPPSPISEPPPSPNDAPDAESPADPQAPQAPQAPPTGPVGRFKGVVLFRGAVPAPVTLQATKDEEVCSLGAGFVQDVQVTDGRLAGAVVELRVRKVDRSKFVTPEGGFVLRQKDCLFTPRLLVAFDGAELTVHNDDQVAHNVNTGSWNLLQSPDGEPIRQKIVYQGTPFARVTCNIHSWMESWVYVARSPHYGVSGQDGQFAILDIPPGHYRGTITHATLGKQSFKVDIFENKETNITFQFPER